MRVLTNLEPERVFYYFEEICGIPHGSGNTKAISNYLVEFAVTRGLWYKQDSYGNVIIKKAGSFGYENSNPVIIQGHMDMVCEKDGSLDINMEKEGLKLVLEDGIISAEGTTLGGDDGIAVAYALAILESDEIKHPPIEAVFTVDEEIGMLGAAALDCSSLSGRLMLNLDSEEEGYLLVSCAGGITATCHLPVSYEESVGNPAFTMTITGLLGGHSGVDIDKYRANSNLEMGRILYALSRQTDIRIVSASGGLKDNAIPRETTVSFVIKEKNFDMDDFIKKANETLGNEYRSSDPGIKLVYGTILDTPGKVLTENSTKSFITALFNLPNGIYKMNTELKGLVLTSLNMGIMLLDSEEARMSFSVRSSIGTEKDLMVNRLSSLMESLGGFVTTAGAYPAWEYKADSMLRTLMADIYTEMYGSEPITTALHAGVECGLFSEKLAGLDCVSYGPDMKDIHTPKESMSVQSVKRVWDYTLRILEELK